MKFVIGDPANIGGTMVKMGNDRFPNMGVLYIFGYLREKMKNLDLYYLRCNLELNQYIRRFEEIKPDVYGISFSSWVSDIAYKTINAVKDRFPELPIICGGTHPTAAADEVLARSKADICVIGEGEQTVLELMEYFQLGKGMLSEINGIAYRENGSVKVTQTRQHITDLGSIPLPAWDMINFEEYAGLGYCKAKPSTVMVFSRGCPFHCVYCSNPVWRSSKPWLRLRPPEDIQKEVKLLYEKGIREIWIRADEFNSNLKWTLEVCDAIKELNYKDLYFECNLRADKVTEELVKAFQDINLWMINLGIESFNQRVLDGIKKKITVQEIIDTCKLLKKYGIRVYAWLMYYQVWEEDGRLCWETPEEVNNSLRMARRMHKEGLIDLMSWQVATPIPGAEMFNIVEKYGIISQPDQYNFWKVSTAIPGIPQIRMHIDLIKGMLLQSYIAYKHGRVGWSTWSNIRGRLKYMANALYNILKK